MSLCICVCLYVNTHTYKYMTQLNKHNLENSFPIAYRRSSIV
jgi:hypothetical protein